MKPILFLSAALAALTAGTAVAGPHPMAIGPKGAVHPVQVPSHVLYSQNSNFGYGIVCQNFTSNSFGTAYNSACADDFVIPDGVRWRINRVDATGVYFNGSGPANSEIVTFYQDRAGRPGKVRASYTLNCADNAGSFSCAIPGAHGRGISLHPRRFWLSVVVNMPFVTGQGEWGWVQNTKIRDNEAMWENPGGGFGTGCTKWEPVDQCLGLAGDFAFDLVGWKR
jgi:hypothetical protein